MKKTATLILLVMMSIKASAGDGLLTKITGENISFMMPKNRVIPRSYGPGTMIAGLACMALDSFETNESYYTTTGGSGLYGNKIKKPFLQQWPRNILMIGGGTMFSIGFVITLKN